MEIILHVLYCSLFIFGLWNAAQKGFILHRLDNYAEAYLPEFLYKPLIGCVLCMASIWGGSYYFYFIGFDFGVLVFIPAVSGLNLFVINLLPE